MRHWILNGSITLTVGLLVECEPQYGYRASQAGIQPVCLYSDAICCGKYQMKYYQMNWLLGQPEGRRQLEAARIVRLQVLYPPAHSLDANRSTSANLVPTEQVGYSCTAPHKAIQSRCGPVQALPCSAPSHGFYRPLTALTAPDDPTVSITMERVQNVRGDYAEWLGRSQEDSNTVH
jgi:hypothetical protein